MSLRPPPARKVTKAPSSLGFRIARKRGSHVVTKHHDGRITVIPAHAGERISIGLLLKIIKDAKTSKKEFTKLLEEA